MRLFALTLSGDFFLELSGLLGLRKRRRQAKQQIGARLACQRRAEMLQEKKRESRLDGEMLTLN